MASVTQDDGNAIIPARLAFLAIYNPSLGRTDDTFRDQVVFYHSREAHARKKRPTEQGKNAATTLQEDENEQLRQIGLAQGMVGFAQNFAKGASLDTVETEKSRIILHELEQGWWILASIDYTRIPKPQATNKAVSKSSSTEGPKHDYSSRDISPPALLTQQLLNAHNVFRLHNGSSLENVYARNDRTKFCALLDRYWTRFALTWNVTLNAIPAADIFGGIRLSAGGELGIGLGEEEWGCGEREVLEDLVARTDGLVDLLVCRFGDVAQTEDQSKKGHSISEISGEPWLGVGHSALSSDGVIFSGTGEVPRTLMRDLASWLQLIYTNGENAYGVRESSASAGKRRKHRGKASEDSKKHIKPSAQPIESDDPPAGIPRSIITAAEKSLHATVATNIDKKSRKAAPSQEATERASDTQPTVAQDETWKKILKLGYGYSWGLADDPGVETELQPEQPMDKILARINDQIQKENAGYFLIGLQGDLAEDMGQDSEIEGQELNEMNQRIMIRTVHMHRHHNKRPDIRRFETDESQASILSATEYEADVPNHSQVATATPASSRLRVLIYVQRPFIHALLFRTDSSSLMMPIFYRDLHTFLSPLHPLLLRRTGPVVGAARRRHAMNNSGQKSPNEESSAALRHDVHNAWEVVHDSETLATIANVPSIDDENSVVGRSDALNLHSAALEVLSSIQKHELERRVKTARGWWVGWAKVPLVNAESTTQDDGGISELEFPSDRNMARRDSDMTEKQPDFRHNPLQNCRQMLLFRRSNDAETKVRARVVSDWGLSGGRTASTNAKLDAGDLGIGFDARRYVEGILGTGK